MGPECFGQRGNLSRSTKLGGVTWGIASDCVWLVLGDKLGNGRRSGWEGKPGSNHEDYYPDVLVFRRNILAVVCFW